MIDIEEMRTVAAQLQEYADIEDTEVGEMSSGLVYLSHYVDYLSEEFQEALYKEMVEQLENFQENATIVETTDTFTQHKIVYLEWE